MISVFQMLRIQELRAKRLIHQVFIALAISGLTLSIAPTFVVGNDSAAEQTSQSSVSVEQTAAKPNEKKKKKPSFPGAKKVILKSQQVQSEKGKLKLRVELKLPKDCKINPTAPMGFLLETVGESGPVDRSSPSKYVLVKPPKQSFELIIPVTENGKDRLKMSLNYYYCQGDPDTGLCQTGSVIWDIPLVVDATATQKKVEIKYAVPAS